MVLRHNCPVEKGLIKFISDWGVGKRGKEEKSDPSVIPYTEGVGKKAKNGGGGTRTSFSN